MVELVANPLNIFMDETTSGLDARATYIVMKTVRNTVDMGRTIVCTIHQSMFKAFDETIEDVPKIKDMYNPATWMLEVSSIEVEVRLGMDFAKYELTCVLIKEAFNVSYSNISILLQLGPSIKEAFNVSYSNIYEFHAAQKSPEKSVENMKIC